ncbi:MAG: protoglobin domain-containing protein [Kofleriaceae bacterium]
MATEYRLVEVLDEILAYVEFGAHDRARLVELHARLAPQFQAIADRFYDRLRARPMAAALLTGSEQLQRLHGSLVDWIASGLLGPYDHAFYDKRSRIGRRHVEIGLPQHYMFTAMNVLRDEYDDRIAELYEPAAARLVMRSVNKLCDLELALMLRHYQLDSEAKLVERERQIQADRLLAIQTLTAGLAHEVRNPLNSAKLQLELLERRLKRAGAFEPGDPKLVDPVELAHHEIERLTRLLTEFLAFARPADLTLGDHDVVEIVRELVTIEHAAAAQHGVELLVVADGPVVAQFDAHKLRQILFNLVRNAVEAVPSAGHVTISVSRDSTHFNVRVEDDGPGIPDEIRQRIYEPFFTTKQRGTGLGLAIVHSMVTLHHGTIDIASNPHGTRIDVAMPCLPAVV